MALKLVHRLPLLGHSRIQCRPAGAFRPSRLQITSIASMSGYVACQYPSTCWCNRVHGCLKLQLDCRVNRSLTTIAREPLFVASSTVGLHRDSAPRFHLTQLHRPTVEEERSFLQRLKTCSSSGGVFKLLCSVETLSDTMAAAALHRVADLEQEDSALRDPAVLEKKTIRELCHQLEQDSGRLSDGGLVSALLACTRLYLDPLSLLMVRLVSESQIRLDKGEMSIDQLCTLGQAVLAMQGPDCVMMHQVMEQIQRQEPAQWSLKELVSVYNLLQGRGIEDGKYRDLLNCMHTHAVTVTSCMDRAAVSGVLRALVTLNQLQALPLVISLCKQSVRHVPHFTDQELTHVLDALMHFGHSDHYLVEALERYIPTVAFTSHPETISKVMQFLGSRRILSPAIFDAVAESFVYRVDEYTTSQVTRQIAAFGILGYHPPNAGKLFRKVEIFLQARLSHFQPRTLLNLLHTCILVERFPVNFVPKVFNKSFLQQLHEQNVGIHQGMLGQLTQLYMAMILEYPFYEGPKLPRKYRIKSFRHPPVSLETPVDLQLYNQVKIGLVDLLGARSYFASQVLTPYCYTLDVEIKLDEEGFVLPASHNEGIHKRIALCIDGQNRFASNTRQLLGKEAIKQRHLQLLEYKVVQIPFYEFENLQSKSDTVEYLHKKIFPQTYRLSW